MKQLSTICIVMLFSLSVWSQKEFHVTTTGKSSGDGTQKNPWDLQTALSQKPEVINGDDTIWLHEGIYTGRFVSNINSTIENKYITVAPYNNGKVILNGNVKSDGNGVLNVKGKQVIFRDFEITWLGGFPRNEGDPDFQVCAGISHTGGADCRFYNLTIHNNPGLGIGSWKATGGTIIENCMIYHNGYVSIDGKGRGEGMYVQNQSDKTRLIQNNIIFGNYYKAIEVWSAGRHKDFQFVKNITIKDNVIFNSGNPSGNSYDNIIIATDDRNGINIANNIKVLGNVLYHNTDYVNNVVNGNAPSLTLGFTKNSPVENIVVKDNIILGRNNAVRFLHVKSLIFEYNTVYSGYIVFNKPHMKYTDGWKFDNNKYFTKKKGAYRVENDKNYSLGDWQTTYNLDKNSQWSHIKEFDLNNVLSVNEHTQNPGTFTVALFNKLSKDVEVDFSNNNISKGTSYAIYDVENRSERLTSGIVSDDKKIIFPMSNSNFTKPLHNDKAQKTLSNFGVFIIEFEDDKTTSSEEASAFQRFLKWLGL